MVILAGDSWKVKYRSAKKKTKTKKTIRIKLLWKLKTQSNNSDAIYLVTAGTALISIAYLYDVYVCLHKTVGNQRIYILIRIWYPKGISTETDRERVAVYGKHVIIRKQVSVWCSRFSQTASPSQGGRSSSVFIKNRRQSCILKLRFKMTDSNLICRGRLSMKLSTQT